MNILALESSCDETAAAILSFDKSFPDTSSKLLSNVVVSQIDIFKAYGGVIPEVAARSHLEAVLPVIDEAFKKANLLDKNGKNNWDKIDAIAVTNTPGLLGSLLIGTLTARTLAILHKKPLYPIHHLKSHIYSCWLSNETAEELVEQKLLSKELVTNHDDFHSISPSSSSSRRAKRLDDRERDRMKCCKNHSACQNRSLESSFCPTFPLLALVISGGHTQIIRMESDNSFEIIGTTLDDAVGECFDKVAKILGLPYPGGPSVSEAAKSGNPDRYPLPIPNIRDLDFSFSGLKTAVLRAVQKEVGVPISYPSHELKNLLTPEQVADFSASFEKTATEILLKKLKKALKLYPDTKSIVFAGGVSANQYLRSHAESSFNLPVFFPPLTFSGDNAAMVALAAAHEIATGVEPTDPYKISILPRSAIN